MARTSFIGVLVLFLAASQIVPIGRLRAQAPGTAGHEHLTEVACVDVPPGGKRPEFGCFNVGTVTGLHFSQASVYWHLRAFPSRKAADAAKSATGHCRGGRRASVALRIRSPRRCSAGR